MRCPAKCNERAPCKILPGLHGCKPYNHPDSTATSLAENRHRDFCRWPSLGWVGVPAPPGEWVGDGAAFSRRLSVDQPFPISAPHLCPAQMHNCPDTQPAVRPRSRWGGADLQAGCLLPAGFGWRKPASPFGRAVRSVVGGGPRSPWPSDSGPLGTPSKKPSESGVRLDVPDGLWFRCGRVPAARGSEHATGGSASDRRARAPAGRSEPRMASVGRTVKQKNKGMRSEP